MDTLLEESRIDGATAFVCRLYGDRGIVNGIIDNKQLPMDASGEIRLIAWDAACRQRREATAALIAYADQLIAEMPLEKRGAMASIALHHMDKVAYDTAHFMSHWAIGDRVEGGYGEWHNKPVQCIRGTAMPFKKTWRKLNSPIFIRRYVKRESEAIRVRELASRVLTRLRDIDPALIHGGIKTFERELAQSERRRRAYDDEQWQGMRQRYPIDPDQEPFEHDIIDAGRGADGRIKLRYVKRKKKLKPLRKRIIKGYETAISLIGEDKVRAFHRGEAVVLEGSKIDLAVKRSGSMGRLGHSAIQLSALGMQGQKLADLCFYIDETPGIDQLTAIALHCAAGCEDEIIETANIIHAEPLALEHPVFAAKREAQIRAMAERMAGDATLLPWTGAGNHQSVSFREMADERDKFYWEKTKGMWLESTGVFMLSPKYYKLMLKNREAGLEPDTPENNFRDQADLDAGSGIDVGMPGGLCQQGVPAIQRCDEPRPPDLCGT